MFVIRQGCLLNYCFGGSYVSTCGVELKEEILGYLQHIIYLNPVFSCVIMSLRFYCAICYWTHVFLHLMLLITYVDKSQGTMTSENLLILLCLLL